MWTLWRRTFQAGNKWEGLDIQHPFSTNARKTSVADTDVRGESEVSSKIMSWFRSHTQNFGFYSIIRSQMEVFHQGMT